MESTATPPNDIIPVDDDNTLRSIPITPVASRAIIQGRAMTSTTPEASASLVSLAPISPNNSAMLREWNVPPDDMTQLQTLRYGSSPVPPVAPAVLLIQREGSTASNSSAIIDETDVARISNSYQYPVATAVTNLVRSVSEIVRGEIRDHTCTVQRSQMTDIEPVSSPFDFPTIITANGENNCVNNNNVGINNDVVPIIPVTSSQASLSNASASNHSTNNTNPPLVPDFEDDNQQWMVINGEIVCLLDDSQAEDSEANELYSSSIGDIYRDDDDHDFMQRYDRQTSKSSRVHRGVRKLRKMRGLRNLFPGGNNAGGGQKKKGDKNKIIKGESTRRKRRESLEQGQHQGQSQNHNSSLDFSEYGSNEFNDDGGGGELSTLEAESSRLLRDAVSDDGNESGDGASLIEAPNSEPLISLSHQTTVTSFSSGSSNTNNNSSSKSNSNGGDNSTIQSKFHSEEFPTRTIGSVRSTYSGPTNNLSPKSSNKGQKKRAHLLRWLRGSDSAASNRSVHSNASSGSGSSMLRKKKHKQSPSSSDASMPLKFSKDLVSATNSIQNRPRNLLGNNPRLSAGRRGFSPTPTTKNGKPAALEPQRASQGFMPPLREAFAELSASSLHRSQPPSLGGESQLKAPPAVTDNTGDLHGVPSVPSGQQSFQSIAAHANFVGHADLITAESGLLPQPEYYIEGFDEYDKYDDKKIKSMKNSTENDKQEGPSIDIMLERAGEIAKDLEAGIQDEDAPLKLPPSPTKSAIIKGKSGGESVPLSMANPGDEIVHNDTLKLVLVGDNAVDKSGLGRSLRKSTKRPRQRTRLAVDVHTWTPSNADVRFTMWEVLTSKSEDPYLPNFGARPGTQSLFFSDQSLYLLVYDLGASNPETLRHSNQANEIDSDEECSDDEWDDHHNAYLKEEANRKADRALQADIKDRVLSWVNCIARRGTGSAILPIALVPSHMSPEEAERRCHLMQTSILNYVENLPSGITPPKILCGPETVVCVSLHNDMGLEDLERMILEIADASHKVFHHVGRSVPPGTVEIMNVCRDLKTTHKMILVDHLIAKLPKKPEFSAEAVIEVLCFLANIGEVLYFGCSSSFVLKRYVILSRKWLVSALSCILRNDLQRELSETRQLFFYQNFYSDQQFPESRVTKTFSGNNSSCPILSCQDIQMLWQSANFMMEAVVAVDQSSQRSEDLTTSSTMFDFLQHLLEKSGVFMPLEIVLPQEKDSLSSTNMVYFVPSLLSQASSRDVWTYKSSESWLVTLCHTWLFRDGAPAGLMEQVTIALLRDLYESSDANYGQSRASMTKFVDSRDGEPEGKIKIYQINCWKNSLLVKIGRYFRTENGLRETIIEIFVAVTDQVSPHSVASDAMRSNMQRLVVSGKGEVGLHGHKLWKGGYNIVLDSIKASMSNCTNVERQVVCPECLAHRPACSANTWSWDSVLAASGHTVRCMMGHRADRDMICGTAPVITKTEDGGKMGNVDKKPVKDLFPSVVIVGLWDNEKKEIVNVGSGFIANKKLGLVVTAGHIFFDMAEGSSFGAPYHGLRNASAIIGVIPNGKKNNTTAVFRYVAKIVADDIHNMDACILKITSRLESDVHNHELIAEQPKIPLENLQEESLSSLNITKRFEIEQAVRIIGFNQGGEGRLKMGEHVNTASDFALGYICKQFKIISDDSSTSSDDSSSSEEGIFMPREEIVVMCKTIKGHSGGPCVNDDGKVVGILSRSDPVDRQRCYLVPSSEIKLLISKAKNRGVGKGY